MDRILNSRYLLMGQYSFHSIQKNKKMFLMISCFLFTACSQNTVQDREQDSLVKAGDRMQASGDSSSAINVYKSALEKKPEHRHPLMLKLGDAYVRAGDLDQAKRVYEEALPIDEHNDAKKQLARLHLTSGHPELATPILEDIVQTHKDDVMALNGLGVSSDIQGDHQMAQHYYHKALEINSANDEVKSNLGLSLAFEGKYEDALKYLQPLGENIAASSKQRHNLALVYALNGEQTKAQEIYAKDMESGEVNENLHLLKMAPKPQVAKKIIPDEEVVVTE
jgi:Flp pilus assembly protein TadD